MRGKMVALSLPRFFGTLYITDRLIENEEMTT